MILDMGILNLVTRKIILLSKQRIFLDYQFQKAGIIQKNYILHRYIMRGQFMRLHIDSIIC